MHRHSQSSSELSDSLTSRTGSNVVTEGEASLRDTLDICEVLPITVELISRISSLIHKPSTPCIWARLSLNTQIPTSKAIAADVWIDDAAALEIAALKARIAEHEKEARKAKEKRETHYYAQRQVHTPNLRKGYPDDSLSKITETKIPGGFDKELETRGLKWAVAGLLCETDPRARSTFYRLPTEDARWPTPQPGIWIETQTVGTWTRAEALLPMGTILPTWWTLVLLGSAPAGQDTLPPSLRRSPLPPDTRRKPCTSSTWTCPDQSSCHFQTGEHPGSRAYPLSLSSIPSQEGPHSRD